MFSNPPDYRLLSDKITAIRLALEKYHHPGNKLQGKTYCNVFIIDPEVAKKQQAIANSIAVLCCSVDECWRFIIRNEEIAVMFALAKGMCLSEAKSKIEEYSRRIKSTQEWVKKKPLYYNNWLEALNPQVIINQMMHKSIIVVINPERHRKMWKDFLKNYFGKATTIQRI